MCMSFICMSYVYVLCVCVCVNIYICICGCRCGLAICIYICMDTLYITLFLCCISKLPFLLPCLVFRGSPSSAAGRWPAWIHLLFRLADIVQRWHRWRHERGSWESALLHRDGDLGLWMDHWMLEGDLVWVRYNQAVRLGHFIPRGNTLIVIHQHPVIRSGKNELVASWTGRAETGRSLLWWPGHWAHHPRSHEIRSGCFGPSSWHFLWEHHSALQQALVTSLVESRKMERNMFFKPWEMVVENPVSLGLRMFTMFCYVLFAHKVA